MVLAKTAESMARALLESHGDPYLAVYALVKEADADTYGSRSYDLITCAKGIVKANEVMVQAAREGTPAPAIARIGLDALDRELEDLDHIAIERFEDDADLPRVG